MVRAWVVGLVLSVGLTAGQAFGHGGGLNSEGCHNNRKTGDYHCHRAPRGDAGGRKAPAAPDRASENGTACLVKDRRVLTASKADCVAIGGRVQ